MLITLPSGAGVALSVLRGSTSSLVGVAVSASLLSPAVNFVRHNSFLVLFLRYFQAFNIFKMVFYT